MIQRRHAERAEPFRVRKSFPEKLTAQPKSKVQRGADGDEGDGIAMGTAGRGSNTYK